MIAPQVQETIDAYAETKIDATIKNRLKDQLTIVREISDKAEDVVKKRIQNYSILFGLLLASIAASVAFFGLRTVKDVSARVDSAVATRIEPPLASAERLVSTRLSAVNSSLDQLSATVQGQTDQVNQRQRDIAASFRRLDAIAGESQQNVEASQARADALPHKLDEIEDGLTKKVEQITQQVDEVSVRQSFPTLGKGMTVTYNNGPWKGLQGKLAGERWLYLQVDATRTKSVSPEQIEVLGRDLKAAGYQTYTKMFGVTGPFTENFSALMNEGISDTSIHFFDVNGEELAEDVSRLVAKDIPSYGTIKPAFLDPSAVRPDYMKFLIEQSGLDGQIYIAAPPP